MFVLGTCRIFEEVDVTGSKYTTRFQCLLSLRLRGGAPPPSWWRQLETIELWEMLVPGRGLPHWNRRGEGISAV